MSIRVPKGYSMAGVHCRIKRDPQKQDLTLVMSDVPAAAAVTLKTSFVPRPSNSIAAARLAATSAAW
jgi:glutamate N-acetyltransferase/amino-acid N-acetyltransferase